MGPGNLPLSICSLAFATCLSSILTVNAASSYGLQIYKCEFYKFKISDTCCECREKEGWIFWIYVCGLLDDVIWIISANLITLRFQTRVVLVGNHKIPYLP